MHGTVHPKEMEELAVPHCSAIVEANASVVQSALRVGREGVCERDQAIRKAVHGLVLELMVYTVKKGLNSRLNEATQLCIEECALAFSEELGDCSEFKSVGALEAFCGIAHRAASRILVGDRLCRDSSFKAASYSYFSGHGITGGILLYLPLGPLRNVLATPLSYFQRVRQRRVLSIVADEFQRRISSNVVSNVDAIDWTLDMLKEVPGKPEEPLPLFQMSHEVVHILGASHAPVGMAITQLMWHMILRPADLAALRTEAEDAVAKVGFTERMVEFLPLQDSFIQETNRLYPNNLVSVQRVITGEPFVFQDGLKLPAGTRLAFPTGPHLRDPDVFDNPNEFDGYRFVKLTEDGVKRWAASHAHQHNLVFGYGNHVCPGRFFAVRLIKVIFTKLIMEYDILSDWKGGGVPPSFHVEGSIFPHTRARILLRKRV
ncbi:cytochrome P450 [Byssothecium circinans]|uniref:Cytochrome P450 n=1 Tax=Byssothecium circinans TaxID=147558 RepID=A0A6A5THD1_9PLEO|nr:cytochrome P450 [Byssothecium circinans]